MQKDRQEVIQNLLDYIIKHYSWDIFYTNFNTDSKEYDLFLNEITARGFPYVLYPTDTSPYLLMDLPLEEVLKSKSRKFRSNLRYYEKKLRKAGDFDLERVTSQDGIDGVMEAIFQIEEHSWKSEASTAITSVERQQAFFIKLAEKAADAGWLKIQLIRMGGVPISYAYGLIFNGKYYLEKTSYHNEWASFSPGNVLLWINLQEAFREGLEEFDFLGKSESYKLKWTDKVRPHNTVYVYNKRIIPLLGYYGNRLFKKLQMFVKK
ncbi:GNAT family N-acetyltransferase [Thermodesulfobacteriota bacterium]